MNKAFGGAFGAALLYRFVDVGVLGALPNLYEPKWALPAKLASAWAEAAGSLLAAVGTGVRWRWPSQPSCHARRAEHGMPNAAYAAAGTSSGCGRLDVEAGGDAPEPAG